MLGELSVGFRATFAGEQQAAIAHTRASAEAAERYGAAGYIYVTHAMYGLALVRAGEAKAADGVLQRCAEKMREMGGKTRLYYPVRAEASLALGDLEAARREADEALEMTADSPLYLSWSKLVRARVGIRTGEESEAIELLLREAADGFAACNAVVMQPEIDDARDELRARP